MTAALPPLSAEAETIVIVGAGLAGLRVAEGARAAGFPGRIVLVGDEVHRPYDRPPLSKAVLLDDDHELLPLLPDDQFDALHLDLRLGEPAASIDRASRHLVLRGGERIAYDRLVLATGSSVRVLSGLEADRPGVHYLRNLEDALRLRSALAAAERVLVVGAGVIGLEVAAAAAKRGKSVTVVEAGARAMARAASEPVSRFVSSRHVEAGVSLRFGVVVKSVSATAAGLEARLSDGESLLFDLVVVGVGVTPNDRLAREAGLEVAPGGVVVDGHGMSSDPSIYAAGEVAVHFNARHGRHDRQETWAHASVHGEHVGRSLIAPGEPYQELGSYWSDQYDFSLNVVGQPIGEIDVLRGDPASGQFLVLHLAGGRVVGASAVNATRDLRAARDLIGLGRRFDPAELADPATNLRALARS